MKQFILLLCATLIIGCSSNKSTPTAHKQPTVKTINSVEFDPSVANHTNYGKTYADIVLKTGNLSITNAVSLAGSIASLKWNNKEFIYSGGHGAAFTWAFYPRQETQTDNSECYNPTAEGSEGDNRRPPYNVNPYHGPSSSKILQWDHTINSSHINSQMAFYQPDGATGWGNCTAHYKSTYVSPDIYGTLSPFKMSQYITVNSPNDFDISGTITVLDEHRGDYSNVLIAYLTSNFTRILTYDPVKQTTTEQPSKDQLASTPIIASTPDGSFAIALVVGNTTNTEATYYWTYKNAGTAGYFSPAIQITYAKYTSTPRLKVGDTILHSAHVVVGDLNTVIAKLKIYKKG